MHILLVDDDSFLRDMYATKFKEAGHTVDAAENGEAALSAIAQTNYDVVLLDMVMPGMNGAELLSKATKTKPDTAFVVLSNQGEESDKSVAKEAGAVGYIVKAESIPSEVVKKVESIVMK
ncbi:MAG: response regulator [Candidatus Paceibacterota bacterium]